MTALAFLSSPQEYFLAVVLLCLTCSVLFVLFFACLYRLTTRKSQRYPAHVPERIRLPREEPIDLAKERFDFECRRDAYAEERVLRRVG